MKNIYLFLSAVAIGLLCSCKEKNELVHLTVTPIAHDTTYTAAVPAAQKRVLFVEEFTGATCPYCPDARELLGNIAAQYPGQLIVSESHLTTTPQSAPATSHGSKYDLRNQKATDVFSAFYKAIDHIPQAGFSRTVSNNEMTLDREKWADRVAKLAPTTTPVNVTVSSSFDKASNTAVVKVQAIYTQAVSRKQFLSVEILEDNIVDVQEFVGYFKNDYSFKNTFRDIVTTASGDEFLSTITEKEPGRVYERTIVITNVTASLKPQNCRVVAFVHNNEAGNKEILQAAEARLDGQ